MAGENRRLDDLIADWSPRLRQAFLSAVAKIRNSVTISAIVTLLERGDSDGALNAVGLDPVAFRALDLNIAQAFEDGGDFVMGRIPALRQPDGQRLNVLFDVRNPRAEQWLRDRSSTLVTQILDDQRVMLRQHLTAGMEAGLNPRTVALDLVGRVNRTTGQRSGGVLGLTSAQEEWARNYAARLSSGDPAEMQAALGMTLRDKRFDRTVAKAIREGKPIPAETQAAMVSAYRNRALKYRGDMIGRTEAMASLHASQQEAFQQAIDAGQVAESRVYKTWHSAGDLRVRDTHRGLNGQRQQFRAQFVSPSGATLRYPGDPDAPAAETVNCRCWMETKIDFLSRLGPKPTDASSPTPSPAPTQVQPSQPVAPGGGGRPPVKFEKGGDGGDDPYVKVDAASNPFVEKVRLYQSTWEEHIRAERPEFEDIGLDGVLDAIRSATSVHRSTSEDSPNTVVFTLENTPVQGQFLTVPVRVVVSKSGRVVTAYRTRRPYAGERIGPEDADQQ